MRHSIPLSVVKARMEIRRMKEATHSLIVPVGELGRLPLYEVRETAWDDVPEQTKLHMLLDLVNWEGVTKPDRARIITEEVDLRKLPAEDREALRGAEQPAPRRLRANELDR